MKHYNIICKTYYYEPYIPYRCRKTRYEKKDTELKIPVRSVSGDEAPVVFKLSDYSHESEGLTEIRYFKGKYYHKHRVYHPGEKWGDESYYTVDNSVKCLESAIYPYFTVSYDRSLELCKKQYKEAAKRYLIINDIVWEECGEPRYVINTFGLGHNHGGTGLFVETCYNPNIRKERYFSALDGEKAVAEANRIAAARGDTKNVGRFKTMIEVLEATKVKLKPLKEHGDGDPFINSLDSITENSKDATEAGLLAMCMAFAGV